jgi:hypothetical protein
MQKIGILGGGFGLYGYMPAAIQANYTTLVLSKYKTLISVHPILKRFLDQLIFVDSESELIDESDILVFARTPELQFDLIKDLSDSSKIYFFEKPLAQSIHNHQIAFNHLEKLKIKFSVNYALLRTDWCEELLRLSSKHSLQISINWELKKPQAQWKIESELGGGLFNYYCIHFAPILKQLCIPVESINLVLESNKMEISTDKNCENSINIKISYSSESIFNIIVLEKFNKNPLYERYLHSPFGNEIASNQLDPRISGIIKYYSETADPNFFQEILSFEKYALKFRGLIDSSGV